MCIVKERIGEQKDLLAALPQLREHAWARRRRTPRRMSAAGRKWEGGRRSTPDKLGDALMYCAGSPATGFLMTPSQWQRSTARRTCRRRMSTEPRVGSGWYAACSGSEQHAMCHLMLTHLLIDLSVAMVHLIRLAILEIDQLAKEADIHQLELGVDRNVVRRCEIGLCLEGA